MHGIIVLVDVPEDRRAHARGLAQETAGIRLLALLALLLAGPVLLGRTRFRYAGLGLCWALASLLPFNNVFPRTSVPVADRYLAVGLCAFALLGALLVDRARRPWAG